MRHFHGQSVCMEKACADSMRFLLPFGSPMANCTHAHRRSLSLHPHPTSRGGELLEEGDNATNKMDTVRRDQLLVAWGGL